jgi:acetolactate synthase-1/2/3 large subunit
LTGAHAILQTLVRGGVDTCFTNPGTSEMHLVAGMDAVPNCAGSCACSRGWRPARRRVRPDDGAAGLDPAAPGTGLANGIANLHNARRAGTPMVNLVGDHATYHKRLTLRSSPTSTRWPGRSRGGSTVRSTAGTAGPDTASAIAAAGTSRYRQGGIATLILPADACWSDGGVPADVVVPAEEVVHTEASSRRPRRWAAVSRA